MKNENGYEVVVTLFNSDEAEAEQEAKGGNAMLKKAIFSITDSPFFKGYTAGEDWNGWATPSFEKAEADKYADYLTKLNDGVPPLIYVAETDTFVLFAHNTDEPETWTGKDIETEDGIKHLYDIGKRYLIWDNAEDWWTPEEMVYYYLVHFTDLYDEELETAYEDITEREFVITGTPKHYDIPEYVENYLRR